MRPKLNDTKRTEILHLVKMGHNVAGIAALYKVSRNAIYKLCKANGLKITRGRQDRAKRKLMKLEVDKL